MSHIMSRGIYYALLTILIVPSALIAQKPQPVPQAPIPSQITAAKKIFISNAGGEDTAGIAGDYDATVYNGGPDRAYNQFYAAIKNWRRYELVSTPADADLLFEIRFKLPTPDQERKALNAGQFRLAIRDPKTQAVLWVMNENVAIFFLKATGSKNYDSALSRLVQRLKDLVGT